MGNHMTAKQRRMNSILTFAVIFGLSIGMTVTILIVAGPMDCKKPLTLMVRCK
jgi:hypothetical protein